jgi:hypothetical protein
MRTIGHVAEDMTGARGSGKPRNNELSRTESGSLVAATHPADPEGVLAARAADGARADCALHALAVRGRAAELAELLAAGANAEARDPLGFTALHYAASHGHQAIPAPSRRARPRGCGETRPDRPQRGCTPAAAGSCGPASCDRRAAPLQALEPLIARALTGLGAINTRAPAGGTGRDPRARRLLVGRRAVCSRLDCAARRCPCRAPPPCTARAGLAPLGRADPRGGSLARLSSETCDCKARPATVEREHAEFGAAQGASGAVAALLRAGAAVEREDFFGWRPLHNAAVGGAPSVRPPSNTSLK